MSSFNITPFPPQTGIKRPVPIESGARRTSIEGLCPYEDWLRQCFYPLRNFQYKKRTSHERFVNTSGVRFKKPQLPRFGAMILELKTGRKRNGGLKRIDIRESRRYRAATRF